MNIEEILDMLDELLDKSWSLPLSGGRSVVDDEKIRELLDDIRLNLPSEIKQAKAIVADRADILATAKREADAVVRRAEDRARALIAQEEIIKQAQQKAAEILSQAQTKAKELRNASQDFSDDLLRQSEETLTKLLTEVRTTRQGDAKLPAQIKSDRNPRRTDGRRGFFGGRNCRSHRFFTLDIFFDEKFLFRKLH